MKNFLIIHGHFYQPPRENPCTGLVPRQSPAAPYENWNYRITKECYAANAASRLLDPSGNIIDIINNYGNISFNFGPTLLAWLKSYAPFIYDQIIEADKVSLEKNAGHGNAIAQGYNHSILPLCSPEDAETQIIWGLNDFEAHFGRNSEGLWLPETAVNPSIINCLIQEGVKFIILSPWQAEAYCPIGSQKWKSLDKNSIPSDRVYRLDRPGGGIAVFFYNHQLAHGISFEHYLKNADALYEKLLEYRQELKGDHLVNIATDGEIYGHHEPFGDMCLAALSKIVERENDFILTNYGRYLAEHPPVHLVRLRGGEADLGTSWSCFHGVSRWFKDCGCSTGSREGWNQKWRTPLRDALNSLRNSLKDLFVQQMSKLSTKDPQQIRNQYIDVLTGKVERIGFAQRFLDKVSSLSQENLESFFSLLEGQKNALFMFTSCAWFFADLSGIETIQNLAYAVRAIELFQGFSDEPLLENFLTELEMARSNIKKYGSGRNIVESTVLPSRQGLSFGAALFIVAEWLKSEREEQAQWGKLPQERWDREPAARGGGFLDHSMRGIFKLEELSPAEKDQDFRGEIEISTLPTLERRRFFFALRREKPFALSLQLWDWNPDKRLDESLEVGLTDLPADLKSGLIKQFTGKLLSRSCGAVPGSAGEVTELLQFARTFSVKPSAGLTKLAELTLEIIIEQCTATFNPSTLSEELKKIEILLPLIHYICPDLNTIKIEQKLSHLIAAQADRLSRGIVQTGLTNGANLDQNSVPVSLLQSSAPEGGEEQEAIRNICLIVQTCNRIGLHPELTRAQNAVFKLLNKELYGAYQALEQDKNFESLKKIRRLIKLASLLQINVEKFKETFFAF